MKRCTLCGRKISNTRYNYGLGCLKKLCCCVKISNVKNLKGENILDKKILKLCNKKTLPITQRKLLTDRYLTLNLLNEIPLDCYNHYKNLLRTDIDTINSTTTIMNLHSYDVITLKQASEINKKYKENEDTFQKIINGEYNALQNFSFDIIKFAFSKYYNDKPYLSDMIQKLQYYILKCGVLGLKVINYDISAKFLEHSLQENPTDITITDDKIIQDILEDNYFKNKLNEIIKKYGNSKNFNTDNESLAFENGDLFFSLHNSNISVFGIKQDNGKWNLDITLSDTYDFTNLQEIEKYINNDNFLKGLFGSIGNNLAMISTSCNVVNEYEIIIKFKIDNWEVYNNVKAN